MSDSHILCDWTWNSSQSKLDSAGSSPDGMIRPNSLVIHFWILSRVPRYQYIPQSDQDTGLILDILLSSLISSVQNWFMQLMNEIQIPCNDHCIPESHQSHIPPLSTISLGSNSPDLPSILQVLVSTLGLGTCCSLCLDQTSLFSSHAKLLTLQTSAQMSPLQTCLHWQSHAKERFLCYSLSEPPISFFGSIYHNLQLSMFTYLSHPENHAYLDHIPTPRTMPST